MVRFHSTASRRQGVILLLVVIMLALFLVVGLSFMLYAESEATASRIYREAFTVNYTRADCEPQTLLNWALGQLIYDVSDYGDGVYSAMRGHSLARNMYGWNYVSAAPDASGNYTGFSSQTNAPGSPTQNTTPFNGYGKLDPTLDPPPPGMPPGTDTRKLINFTFFVNPQTPAVAFLRDPERVGIRKGPDSPLEWPSKVPVTAPYSGGWNVPYTFPDRNNIFLAALKANANGTPQVLMQSFHRPQGTPFEVANPNPTQLTNPAPWLDTTDPSLKYMVLRPRPADMWYDPNDPSRSFPLPASDTGDVQNLPGGVGMDSFWIDLGYPVQTTRDGTKFKPLFAFLIVDLDNRVNLNVHGNIRASGDSHASNQGWGAWEVNLNHVLNAKDSSAEVQRIFTGGNSYLGRYGVNGLPGGDGQSYPLFHYPPSGTMLAPYLVPSDTDGVDETGAPTTRFRLPSEVASPRFRTVPDFNSPTGYDSMVYQSSIPRERHPGLYNVLAAGRPGNDDQPFNIAENLYYLIGQASGPDYTRSRLFQLGVWENLAQPRIRHMLTTLSFDLDSPGARPWIVDAAGSNPRSQYVLKSPDLSSPDQNQFHARGGTDPLNFVLRGPPSQVYDPNSVGCDFLPDDGRCAVLPRLDLNRKLTPYPTNPDLYNLAIIGQPPLAIGPTGQGVVASVTQDPTQQLYRAIWERQQFANEIFERLVKATGAVRTAPPGTPAHNACRYLAQLAVNIVDYIDDDEFMTPFFWNPPVATDVVFGVESPKVVLNEVYSEIRNAPGDDGPLGGTQPFVVHFWIELFNTHMNANYPLPDLNSDLGGSNRGWARLEVPVPPTSQSMQAAYRIRVYKEQPGPSGMRALDNVKGDPMFSNPSPTPPDCEVTQYSSGTGNPGIDLKVIEGNDGTAAGVVGENKRGVYVIASEYDIYDEPPASTKQPTNRITAGGPQNRLSYTEPSGNSVPQSSHTIVLQRLLCPHLPHNEDPGSTTTPYNPYVTVDYVTGVRAQDAVRMEAPIAGNPTPHANYQQYTNRRSFGRAQPMTALVAPAPGPATHTFFEPNGYPGVSAFDWLVHLDRPLVNVMELLHVSAFKPHEITQTFIDPNGVKFQHVAPWLRGEQFRLYRALEYFTCGDRGYWTRIGGTGPDDVPSSGGRVPGRININTIWDREVLRALTDPKPADARSPNYFDETHVDNAWTALQARRSRWLGGSAAGIADQPFMSFANPAQDPQPNEFPTLSGLAGTRLARTGLNPTDPFLFNGAPAPVHPVVAQEMLAKMANNTTTRSNVFAVYLTVGFFEVMDDTVRPVRLGAEIRARNGLPIRHKMFAVVDRTHLAIDPVAAGSRTAGLEQPDKQQFFITSEEPVYPAETSGGSNPKTSLSIVGGMSNTMYYDGRRIDLPERFTLYADFGTKREILEGCSVTPNGRLSVPNGFRFSHAAGFTLSYVAPGNPGPQGAIDLSDPRFSGVVPYKTIIQ